MGSCGLLSAWFPVKPSQLSLPLPAARGTCRRKPPPRLQGGWATRSPLAHKLRHVLLYRKRGRGETHSPLSGTPPHISLILYHQGLCHFFVGENLFCRFSFKYFCLRLGSQQSRFLLWTDSANLSRKREFIKLILGGSQNHCKPEESAKSSKKLDGRNQTLKLWGPCHNWACPCYHSN